MYCNDLIEYDVNFEEEYDDYIKKIDHETNNK